MRPTVPDSPSSLQRLVGEFQDAIDALGVEATSMQLEEWSVLVHESMSGRGRLFHTVEHVFDVSEGAPPIETLGLLYHDTVYWQVDGGLSGQQGKRLEGVVQESESGFSLAPWRGDEDPVRAMVAAVFGFTPGQELSIYGGLNEFLSALMAARSLAPVLSMAQLAMVAAAIEATIPFRDPGPSGEAPAEALAARLAAVNQSFELGLTNEEIEAAVRRSVVVANRDVSNFAAEDPTYFLDNTWKLLPETNHALRGQRLYTVSEYRFAIQKMTGFLGSLDVVRVFRGYKGEPAAETLQGMRERAAKNVALGVRYLRGKLLAALTIEAMAELTGGDAPIAMFMGDLPNAVNDSQRLEHFLPDVSQPAEDVDPDVYKLLAEGRAGESSFDLKTSPLASYLYQALGQAKVDELTEIAKPGTDGWAQALLDAFPAEVRRGVTAAASKIVITRTNDLAGLGS